ncbi:MAG: RNA methyltransferase [Cytophagales bacterium]|nr:RNA methyltransferase [Cytophagales bacterium]
MKTQATLAMTSITSANNPLIKMLKRLAQSGSAYKDAGEIWLEGEHLCDAYLLSLTRSLPNQAAMPALQTAVLSESAKTYWTRRLEAMLAQGLLAKAFAVVVLPDALLAQISSLPSASGLGLVLKLPEQSNTIQKLAHTVVLDRLQDAGNVGSILRSSAAFGVTQVLALQGTAALWSPKVLRAGMGAHFALHLVENLTVDEIQLDVPILATQVHAGDYLHILQANKKLPHPCAWIMGHEGQGVCQALMDKASIKVNIAQSGQESLNVAAAAAVCLFASST